MLELKTKKELSQYAHNLARSFGLVRYRSTTYMPTDHLSGDFNPTPPPADTVWVPYSREDIRLLGSDQYDILFGTDGELSSFEFMVAQNATQVLGNVNTLLVRTDKGLRELRTDGKLHPPTGQFVPNTLAPVLDTDKATKKRVFDTIAEWVDSEEEAHSLLKHLATALSPGWSAVKYILLLGEGRNGKGLLLKMIDAVFGRENISRVTRQHMAEQSPVVLDLNGKLLNLIYDGQADYLKDSGAEKTLVAGEPFPIRPLYQSAPTIVQTNALFVESLNQEPKSKDKSPALQKRLMRFHFPNVYPLDKGFEKTMLSDAHLGAFLALLLDHYVLEDRVALELAPTQKSLELQLEHMFTNSLALQYLKHVEETDIVGASAVIGLSMTELAQRFQSWRLKENDISNWSEPDIVALFQPIITTERRGIRVEGKPRKIRVVSGLKDEATAFIESLKGEEEDDLEALVAD